MSNTATKPAILALEDGTVFNGKAIGAVDAVPYTCGELVFNTSMTGYQEIITDPSYCEQIIMFTQPHIGNVGINKEDIESNKANKIWSNGIIFKYNSILASNWRSENSLAAYLKENNLLGLCDLDTRELTNIIRAKGALRSCIMVLNDQQDSAQDYETAQAEAIRLAQNTKSLKNQDLAKVVTTSKQYQWHQASLKINSFTNNEAAQSTKQITKHSTDKFHIVVYDFGVKQQILKLLADRSCDVTIVPADFSVKELLKLQPDGVLLSNGPGDPAACDYAISNTKQIIEAGVPIFGICLGFQILALCLGAKTTKMKFGHHGGNHPVKDLISNKVLITSQNHGFMVEAQDLPIDLVITHQSLIDQSIQGLEHKTLPVFGFQGHPEASPGPNDIEYLFDKFIAKVQGTKSTDTQRCQVESKEVSSI